MQRATPRNTSHRAYDAGGARTVIDKVNDGPQMQEMSGNFMKGESRKDIEAPQNYGFTSVVMPATKGKDGQIEESAEGFISYMGGNRSFPVCSVMDDRRHRLKELSPGDSAMYRTKDDRQQFLLAGDSGKGDDKKIGGNFMSCRDDRCQRFALVPKPDDGQQKAAPIQPAGQQQEQQGQKKQRGQKSALDDNRKSEVAIEQNGQTTFSQHGQAYSSQKGGSDASTHWEKDKTKSTQCTADHTHIRFQDHRIYNDKEGNWATSPILVKLDSYCKEG